jgi:DNA invertase Pin-like site-specific DNA recombinase
MNEVERALFQSYEVSDERVFQEKASGKSIRNRPELEKAISALGTGDVLVLAEWDRCTRSMIDWVAIIERINAKGALVKVVDKPHLDLTTPLGRGFLAFLCDGGGDERQRIVKRANAGRKAARERGARFGRKPTLSAEQQGCQASPGQRGERQVPRADLSRQPHNDCSPRRQRLICGHPDNRAHLGEEWSPKGVVS